MASTLPENLAAIVAHSIDNEHMVILSQPNDPTETPSVFNTRLENQIVSSLAANLTANYVDSNFPVNFYKGVISESQKAKFDIVTTTDISDISYAISSKYVSINQSLDSNTFNIGTSNSTVTEKISVIAPSNSIYDSNVQFVYADNNGPFLSTSDESVGTYPTDKAGTIPNKGSWTAAFDSNSTNYNYQKAINSEYNTSTNARPMSVSENDSFNQNNALGMDLLSSPSVQNYYTLNSTTGEPLPTAISNSGASSSTGIMSASYRLGDNGLYATKSSGFESISLADCGSYRVQQFPDVALITITEDLTNNATSAQPNIVKFPVFNANNASSLPTNDIPLDQFNSIFNRTTENIVPGYKFTSTVTEAANSGYSPVQDMSVRTDSANTFTLDDSSLLDNATYMEHYVNGVHTLDFDPASLSISAVDSADTNNISLFGLNTQRETIAQADFQNGQIITNNNSYITRYTTDSSSTLAVTPNVFYNTEDSKGGISDAIKNNYYVKYLSQMVMKNSTDISGSFLKNNGCALDLFNNSAICNTLFNSSDFGFLATPTPAAAEIVKIVPNKQLASINGFSDGTSKTPINFMSTFATVQNLKTLASANNVFSSAKMLFTLNDLSSKSIYTATAAAGWSLVSASGNKMVSSSATAFANDNSTWPTLTETKGLLNGSANINYSISIGTNITGNSSAHLVDFVTINWNVDGSSTSNSMTIPQEMLTRVVNSTISSVAIPVTTSLTLTDKLIGRTVEVSQMTSERQLQYSFNLGLRQFTGLTMTTPTITSITHYYVVKDVVTGEFYPNSYLQYVTDANSVIDFTAVTESFSTISSIAGSLTKSDMCDLSVKVQGLDIDNSTVTDLSDTVFVSSMFGISTTFELQTANEAVTNTAGDITLSLECEYLSALGGEGEIKLDNVVDGYVIQLTDDYKTNYTCYNWSAATTANVTTNTNLTSATDATVYNSLSVANGYSNITWSTDYSIKVTYELSDQSTTVLSVYLTTDSTKASLYEIRTKAFSFPITDMYISNVPTDIFRMDRWIGHSAYDNIFTDTFVAVDYTYTNGPVVSTDVFAIDTGVYLTKSSLNSTTFTALSDIGTYIIFALKSDSIGVNMIGSVASLSEIAHGVKTFQYSNQSRILTIPSYRGYYGAQSVDQVYTINRDTMVATLSINSSDNTLPSISQPFNVYHNKQYTVNSLSGGVGSIGLKIKFLESMLSSSETRSFQIYTKGDTVSFTIVNPNATGTYNTAPANSTLKTFSLYTFSGSDFDGTGSPLSINSYRLKIKTNTFNHTSSSWAVQLDAKRVAIYKNSNYLGNPENLDTNNAYNAPDSSKWTNTSTDTYTFNDLIGDGITVNGWTIKTTSIANNYNPSISFFVIMPPYLMFKIASSDTLSLPYTYSASTNHATSYLPISDTTAGKNTYNPFAATKTYSYIALTNGVSSRTIVFDQSITNNVTFVQQSAITLSDYSTSARSVSSQYFVVEANLLTMTLNNGLKGQSGPLISTLFNNLPANRLMYCANDAAHFYMDSLLSSKSGIVMKLLQPEGSNTPYPDLSTSQTFTTASGQTINANITLQIDNFFTLPSKAVSSSTNDFKLDLPTGSGVKSQLYTREIINNNTTGDVTVFVYRYDSSTNVDYSDYSPQKTSVSITYLSRNYKTITLNKAQWQTYFASIVPSATAYADAYNQFIRAGVASINNVDWVLDDSWTTPDEPTSVFTSLIAFNPTIMNQMAPQIFSTTFDGKAKAVYVSKYPIMSVVNKIGQTIYQVTGWGSVLAEIIATRQITLSKSENNNTYSPSNSVAKIPNKPL
jgi:hypothetical protein